MTNDEQTTSTESPVAIQFSYSVGRFNILLERDIKTEIIEHRDIFPIPHAPGWCRGMISLRGKLMPVLNLHKVLQNTTSKASKWLLIVESLPLPQIAISIDALPAQRQVKPDEFTAISDESVHPDWLLQQCTIDGKTFYRADHHGLFEQLIRENDTQQNALEVEV